MAQVSTTTNSKRTMSGPTIIPNPRPAKTPRTSEKTSRRADSTTTSTSTMQLKPGRSSLCRTQSLLSVFPIPPTTTPTHCLAFPTSKPESIPLVPPSLAQRSKPSPRPATPPSPKKVPRERQKSILPPTLPNSHPSSSSGIVIRLPPRPAPLSSSSVPPLPVLRARYSSPFCPTSTPRSPRPFFPRSKKQPNLLRFAITKCMRASPEGRKALLVGPRLAERIKLATMELERIVALHQEADPKQQLQQQKNNDAETGDSTASPTMSNSWVVVPTEEQWEIVDCSA